MKGRIFSVMGVISSSLVPLAVILFGYLYDRGLYSIVNFIAGFIVITIAFIYYQPRKMKQNSLHV
ncbi:hypothetical protein [Alkalihalobacillus pseudalcaliphilus]|uniref:hypothetical protein n=1 Tax=Alkalihalobacillus pseudalcaliphilus TaxID=79884 RepID=UPI00064DBFC7|nr:hypothetical protein [Alkalihalobacillus pseudalcaliphilus]KMK77530.1 hypothetical protein AB990_03415 [Alkalihalobacillus pseudalcaliphilus]